MSFIQDELLFREVEQRDLSRLRYQRNTSWIGYRDPRSVQTINNEERWYESLNVDNQAYMIEDSEIVIGLVRFSNFDHLNRCLDVTGVDVFEGLTGRGYASRIMKAVAKHWLKTLGYHRIKGECTRSNLSMQKALEKAGYKLEGVQRERIFRDGWMDFLQYSLLETEI